ncbi:hypothetical protein ABIA16_003789 [Sinorhizobium fredii]
MEYYVYIWRDATGLPFYVGKGKGKRAHNTTKRSKEFKEVHAQGGCTVEIVDYFIHESQAHAHEIELIEFYGRRDIGGALVNKTDGGEGNSGWIPSDEVRAKISAKKKGVPVHSAAWRAKMSAAHRGKSHSDEAREKIRISKIGKPLSDEHKAKLSAANSGRVPSDDIRVKIGNEVRMRPPRDGYKGVYFDAKNGKWMCRAKINGKTKYLGRFASPEDAAMAYDHAAVAAWGRGNCYLNFPDYMEAA